MCRDRNKDFFTHDDDHKYNLSKMQEYIKEDCAKGDDDQKENGGVFYKKRMEIVGPTDGHWEYLSAHPGISGEPDKKRYVLEAKWDENGSEDCDEGVLTKPDECVDSFMKTLNVCELSPTQTSLDRLTSIVGQAIVWIWGIR